MRLFKEMLDQYGSISALRELRYYEINFYGKAPRNVEMFLIAREEPLTEEGIRDLYWKNTKEGNMDQGNEYECSYGEITINVLNFLL